MNNETTVENADRISIQQSIMLHITLGADVNAPRDTWGTRNYFRARGDEEITLCEDLVKRGLMREFKTGCDHVYEATRKGEDFVFRN